MPEFDPSQPFEKVASAKSAPEFDPSQPFEKVEGPGVGPSLQAGLEHFGNAASMGYLPHMQAAAEKPMSAVLDLLTGNKVTDSLPDYVTRRDENIKRLSQEEEEHPAASIAGTIGGSVASAVPAGAALMKIPALAGLAATEAPALSGLAARGAALAARTAGSAGAAAIQGAVANPGDEEGEVSPLQLEDRAKRSALSAAVAAPLHLAGEGLSSVGSYISNKLKGKAEDLAFRALGPFKRQVNQNRDEIKDIGREALDSGIVRWTPGSAATLEERASEAAGKTGKDLGDLTDKLIQSESEATSSGIDRKKIGDAIRERLLIKNPQGIPGIDQRNQVFENMAADFEQDPTIKQFAAKNGLSYIEAEKLATEAGYKTPPLSFADLRQAKMNVQGTEGKEGLINWNRLKNADIPVDEQFHRALAGELRKGEEAGAEAIEKSAYGGSSHQLKDLKDKYGNLMSAKTIAGNKADAQRANQILGLKDVIVGGAGGTIGSILGHQLDEHGSYENAKLGAEFGAAAGAIGNKLARDYGSQISSKAIDGISRLMAKSPVIRTIIDRNPTLIPQLALSFDSKKSQSK